MDQGVRASACGVLVVLVCLVSAPLALGSRWDVQAIPPIAFADGSWGPNFMAVSCVSGRVCVALGQNMVNGALVIERLIGGVWSPDPVADLPMELAPGVVSCASPDACFAAVFHGGGGAALALRWDGNRWSLNRLPNPAKPNELSSSLVSDVSCTSRSFCMVVGTVGFGGESGAGGGVFPDRPFAERWNGRRWLLTAARDGPHRRQGYDLDTVSCWSRTGCVAVGLAVGRDGPAVLVERWNGRQWLEPTLVDLRALARHTVAGLSCPAANRCFAVGGRVVAQLNGGRWTEQTLGRHGYLSDISCASATGCTAVGSIGPNTLAEHWNGRRWATEATPRPPTTGLHGHVSSALVSVSCRRGNGCTAVGATATPSESDNALPLIEHRAQYTARRSR